MSDKMFKTKEALDLSNTMLFLMAARVLALEDRIAGAKRHIEESPLLLEAPGMRDLLDLLEEPLIQFYDEGRVEEKVYSLAAQVSEQLGLHPPKEEEAPREDLPG